MKVILKLFLKDSLVKITLFISLLFNAITWLILILYLPHEEFIPLSYNVHIGINWSGPWWYVLFIPSLGLVILFGNYLTASLIFLKEKILNYFFIITAAVVQIIFLAFGIVAVLLNR